MKHTKIITLSLFASLSLSAAQIPNIGDAMQQVKSPKMEKEKPQIPKIQTMQIPLKEFANDKKVAIKDISVKGIDHISPNEVETIVASYKNKELKFSEIEELASAITKLYRSKGYFVAKAYIPQQDIFSQGNNLVLQVIEGNYGEFYLENSSLVKDSILQGNLDDIKDKDIVSTYTLERAMLIINDTPGAIVNKAEVRPGKKLGTSDFTIGTVATKRYNGYILADNYGSQYTGKHRFMVGGDINSPFNRGDKISLSALSSENQGLLNGRVAYNFPLHSNGLRGEVSYSKTSYELGSDYKSLDATGSSDSINFKIEYPYIRSRMENLNVYLDTSYNKMKDEIGSTATAIKKDSLVAAMGLDYTKDLILFSKDSQTRASVSYTYGKLNFKDKNDEITDKNGADTQGNFSKINIELGQDFQLSDTLRLENSIQMQYALNNKNLDGSQDLSLGGINGVKFYPDGEQSGENGYIFNTELFYTLPSIRGINSSVSLFYDVGRTFMSKNYLQEDFKTLQDFGIGYYGSYKDMFINAHIAHNIAHEVTSQKNYSNRLMVQAGLVF